MRFRKIIILCCSVLLFASWSSPVSAQEPEPYVSHQEPEFLNFEELKTLLANPHPGGSLEEKLDRFWTTPILNNEAWYRGARPHSLKDPFLGSFLRVASWNIEKSFRTPEVVKMMTSSDELMRMIDPDKAPEDPALYKKIVRQWERLTTADVLILQEMDIGHKRSGYLNAAQEIATALNMNYAYGAEQLEIDPVYLGTESLHSKEGALDQEMTNFFAADPKRYKGVFGSAVLSRYPIKHVEIFQLKNQPYDWYTEEKPKPALVERTRRLGTRWLFKNRITREMKVGGRIYFRVDLDVPELPERTLTVINIHLEIKCQPKGRAAQMAEILSYIKNIRHPVIVMGDFNAASTDISPTSVTRIVKRSAKDPSTWVNGVVSFLTPYGPLNLLRQGSNLTRNFQNPLMRHIPILAPNSLRKLFQRVENFRFEDGGAFDFRGDKNRSMNHKSGKLANANERDFKGFKTTFRVKRPIGPLLGKLRLDWVFVKSFLKAPNDPAGPYQFAPHFGETLEELNTNLDIPLSDHHPNIVDLPFGEPGK